MPSLTVNGPTSAAQGETVTLEFVVSPSGTETVQVSWRPEGSTTWRGVFSGSISSTRTFTVTVTKGSGSETFEGAVFDVIRGGIVARDSITIGPPFRTTTVEAVIQNPNLTQVNRDVAYLIGTGGSLASFTPRKATVEQRDIPSDQSSLTLSLESRETDDINHLVLIGSPGTDLAAILEDGRLPTTDELDDSDLLTDGSTANVSLSRVPA